MAKSSIEIVHAILAKVSEGEVTYMEFMEDTFGTAATFRSSDVTILRSDPAGGEVSISIKLRMQHVLA